MAAENQSAAILTITTFEVVLLLVLSVRLRQVYKDKLFLCVPMQPEELRELLKHMGQPNMAHTLPDGADNREKASDLNREWLLTRAD